MSGMVGAMAAPTATALAARTSGGASSLSATRPVSLPGVSDSLNRRLAVGSRRPRARTAPVVAVAGSTSPAPDGRPRTASSSPRPGSEIVTAAVSDPSTVTVEDEFHRRSSELGRTKKKKKGGRASRFARNKDHLKSSHLDGVRQGWPLAKLLESLPPIPSPDAISMDAAAPHVQLYETLVDCGRLHNAVELLRALRDAGLDGLGARVSHKNFLRQCARREAVAVAFEFVAFVDHPDVRLYNMLLSVCAAAGDSRSGFAAFVLMYDAGVEPDCRAYTTLISACAKAGELEKAFETFRRMEMDGVSPSVVTYGALMDALSRRVGALTGGSRAGGRKLRKNPDDAKRAEVSGEVGRLLRRCFALREEMDDAGVVPDACVLNSLLAACGRAAAAEDLSADALSKAFALYEEMETSRITCDAYTYASLITACVNAGDADRALELYARSGRVKRTAAVFAAAIHACGSTSDGADLPAALAIWEDMRAESVEADAMLYATLMDVSGRAGERAVTERVMFEMERDGVAPTGEVFATLAGIAARDGDVAGVEKVLQEIGARGSAPPRDVFNALIAAAARRGDVDAADDAEVRLRAAGLSGDSSTYENLVRAAAAADRPELAWEYYERAVDLGVEITLPIFNALVVACGRAGLLQRTFDAVDLMRAAGHEPDETTWRELLSSCAKHGDAELAWETYKRSRKAGQPPNEVALNIIIGVTLLKIRELTDPENKGNAKRQRQSEANADANEPPRNATGDVEPEWKEWADRAIAVYHEATVAGVRPRLATFSAMLACLRPPTLPALRAVDRDARGSDANRLAREVSREDDAHEDARKYYPLRALILYEEAQALGVVPKFYMENDNVYDIRGFPPAAAEVAVLTLLRVFRRYSDSHVGAGEVDLPNVTLRVLSDDEMEEMLRDGDRSNRRLARTGDRVVVLLRRLRFNYGGSLERGRIELSGNVIRRWLKAKPPPPETIPGSEPRLAGALQDQTRSIRARGLGGGDEESWTGPEGFFGASPATTGRGRGLGSGSTGVDFFGAEDQRYSADSQDEGFSRRGRGKKGNSWNKGWVQDDADEDCMMSELTRITGASRDSYDGDGSSRDDAEAEGA